MTTPHPRHDSFIRAATVQIDRVLTQLTKATLEQIASDGMIRRRYIRIALQQHPHILITTKKGKTYYSVKEPSNPAIRFHTKRPPHIKPTPKSDPRRRK